MALHHSVHCSPGPIKTYIWERNGISGEPFGQQTALKRVGESSEVSTLIRFLASNEASYITGETVTVDGGYCVHSE